MTTTDDEDGHIGTCYTIISHCEPSTRAKNPTSLGPGQNVRFHTILITNYLSYQKFNIHAL